MTNRIIAQIDNRISSTVVAANDLCALCVLRGKSSPLWKQIPTILRRIAELLFNSQKLVVLGHSVAARRAARFNLPRAESDSQVGDRALFGFPATMAHHVRVAAARRQSHRLDCFSKR